MASKLQDSWNKLQEEQSIIKNNIIENLKLQKEQLYTMHPESKEQQMILDNNTKLKLGFL